MPNVSSSAVFDREGVEGRHEEEVVRRHAERRREHRGPRPNRRRSDHHRQEEEHLEIGERNSSRSAWRAPSVDAHDRRGST
jgi:hypothetical protein